MCFEAKREQNCTHRKSCCAAGCSQPACGSWEPHEAGVLAVLSCVQSAWSALVVNTLRRKGFAAFCKILTACLLNAAVQSTNHWVHRLADSQNHRGWKRPARSSRATIHHSLRKDCMDGSRRSWGSLLLSEYHLRRKP